MLAPVLSQPSLPLNDPAGLEIAPEEIAAVRDRLEREDLTVLACRFAGDRFCRAERFAAYAAALGDRFIGRVLPDSAAGTDLAQGRILLDHSVSPGKQPCRYFEAKLFGRLEVDDEFPMHENTASLPRLLSA
jgi:hypothetical protein